MGLATFCVCLTGEAAKPPSYNRGLGIRRWHLPAAENKVAKDASLLAKICPLTCFSVVSRFRSACLLQNQATATRLRATAVSSTVQLQKHWMRPSTAGRGRKSRASFPVGGGVDLSRPAPSERESSGLSCSFHVCLNSHSPEALLAKLRPIRSPTQPRALAQRGD